MTATTNSQSDGVHTPRRRTQSPPIPGPKSLNPLKSTLAFQRTPLQFLSTLIQEHGDLAQFHLLTMPVIVINHPDYIKHVLQDKNTNYDKDVFLFKVLTPLLGNGLVSAIGG